jgi:hypothetical protein
MRVEVGTGPTVRADKNHYIRRFEELTVIWDRRGKGNTKVNQIRDIQCFEG